MFLANSYTRHTEPKFILTVVSAFYCCSVILCGCVSVEGESVDTNELCCNKLGPPPQKLMQVTSFMVQFRVAYRVCVRPNVTKK